MAQMNHCTVHQNAWETHPNEISSCILMRQSLEKKKSTYLPQLRTGLNGQGGLVCWNGVKYVSKHLSV